MSSPACGVVVDLQMVSLVGFDVRDLGQDLVKGHTASPLRSVFEVGLRDERGHLLRDGRGDELVDRDTFSLGQLLDLLVKGLWKPEASNEPNQPGETWTNGYTDRNGLITLPYSALTTGEMYYSVEDGLGNSEFNVIKVVK